MYQNEIPHKGDPVLPTLSNAGPKHQITSDVSDLFKEYEIEREQIRALGDHLKNFEGPFQYFLKGNKLHSSYTRHMDPEMALKALDSEFWERAISRTDMLDYMSASERSEWRSSIAEFRTPSFTRESLFATLDTFLSSKDMLLAKKVDGIFRSLSGEHVTNSPMAFSKKMIISNALDSFGSPNYRICEILDDLRGLISKYMGRDSTGFQPRSYSTMKITGFGEEVEIDGGALSIKAFKVGTLHIQVHPEIALHLNEVLSTLHPSVIASKSGRAGKAKKSYSKPLRKNFLSDGVIRKLMDISDYRYRSIYTDDPDVIDILEYLGALFDGSSYHLPSESLEGLHEIIRLGCYPDKKSNQYYPTKTALAKLATAKLGKIENWERVLEPSAGQGGLADFLPVTKTLCVEIDPVNSAILKGKGFKVVEADFLSFDFRQKFHKILMNPPFSEGRALQHLQRAIDLLEDDGTLVAILPASMKGSALISGAEVEWSEVIEGQFDDTDVRVTVLRFVK